MGDEESKFFSARGISGLRAMALLSSLSPLIVYFITHFSTIISTKCLGLGNDILFILL